MKKSYMKYILSLLLFGSNGIVASFIALTSYEIVLMRTMLGSLLLLMIFFLSRRKFTFMNHKKQFAALVLAGIALGASWLFLYEAYQQIGVSLSSLLYYCGPVIVMILSPLIFNEKLTMTKVGGFITVLIGIYLVNSKSSGSEANGWGLFCGGMSALMYAAMVIFNKKAKEIKGLENSMIQLFISFMTAAVFIGIDHGFTINIDTSNWLPILFLGFINTGIGCYLYFSSIGHLPVHTVSICGYLEPLSAVIFSAMFLNERLSTVQVAGVILILGGAIFGELFKGTFKNLIIKNRLKYSKIFGTP